MSRKLTKMGAVAAGTSYTSGAALSMTMPRGGILHITLAIDAAKTCTLTLAGSATLLNLGVALVASALYDVEFCVDKGETVAVSFGGSASILKLLAELED